MITRTLASHSEEMNSQNVLQHLRDRGMVPELYESFSCDSGVAVFGLRDFSGKQVGYQNYRPFAERNCKNVQEARYFTYLPKQTNGYFGLESLKWPSRHTRVYIVEGVFKAATLHRLGYASIALMGSETKQHMSQLRLMQRPFLGIGDPDLAGEKFARNLNGYTSPRDLDEMTNSEIEDLLND